MIVKKYLIQELVIIYLYEQTNRSLDVAWICAFCFCIVNLKTVVMTSNRYCLTNFNTSMEWNLHRIYTLRDLGYDPFVMVYDKQHAPRDIIRLQRWVNNKFIFNKVIRFEDYKG